MDNYKSTVAIRLLALEELLIHVAKVAFLTGGVTEEGLSEFRANARHELSLRALPGVDPAKSDHLSAEIQEDVDRIIGRMQQAVSNSMSQLRGELGL